MDGDEGCILSSLDPVFGTWERGWKGEGEGDGTTARVSAVRSAPLEDIEASVASLGVGVGSRRGGHGYLNFGEG